MDTPDESDCSALDAVFHYFIIRMTMLVHTLTFNCFLCFISLLGLKGSGSGAASGPPSSLNSPMTSPTSSPHHHHHHHHSLSRHHSHPSNHHHRSSMDSVFVDLDLSTGSAGDFLGSSSVLTPGSGGDGGIVDLRALAKDRQKKDNHNMSKLRHTLLRLSTHQSTWEKLL